MEVRRKRGRRRARNFERSTFNAEHLTFKDEKGGRWSELGLGEGAEGLEGGLDGLGIDVAHELADVLPLACEPAAGLDPVTSQKIFDLLRKEQRESGATVVMVSSDIDRLLTITDRVGMLYRGELVFDGTTHEAQTSRDPLVKQFIHGEVEGPM